VFVAMVLFVPLLISVVVVVAVTLFVAVATPDLFQVKFETMAVSVADNVADTG
jgi:sensor histidine kinase regulating citrate/malate metabolism